MTKCDTHVCAGVQRGPQKKPRAPDIGTCEFCTPVQLEPPPGEAPPDTQTLRTDRVCTEPAAASGVCTGAALLTLPASAGSSWWPRVLPQGATCATTRAWSSSPSKGSLCYRRSAHTCTRRSFSRPNSCARVRLHVHGGRTADTGRADVVTVPALSHVPHTPTPTPRSACAYLGASRRFLLSLNCPTRALCASTEIDCPWASCCNCYWPRSCAAFQK